MINKITAALWVRYLYFADRASKYRKTTGQSHPFPTKRHLPDNPGQAEFSVPRN